MTEASKASAKCPQCGATVEETKSWDMKHGKPPTRIHLYNCPDCKKQFRTGERLD